MAEEVLQLLNEIRSVASSDYQERIPEAVRDNIQEVGNTIISYQPHLNMFATQLLNRISRTVIKGLSAMEDIYGLFGEESIEFGDTTQKIWIDIPQAKAFEGTKTENPTSMLAIEKGVIHVEYTSVDRKLFYKTTISIPELKEAFVSPSALSDFVNGLTGAMATALARDKYVMDTNMLGTHCNYILAMLTAEPTANVKCLRVPETVAYFDKTAGKMVWTSTGAKEFLKLIKKMSGKLKFYHKVDYADYDIEDDLVDDEDIKTISTMRTPLNKQVVALETDTMAEIDVDALAVLFNLQPAELKTQVLEIEDNAFGLHGEDEYVGGFICDKSLVERGKSFEDTDSFKNPEHEYVNFWNHYWGYRAVSKFGDFCPIVFVAKTPSEEVGA